jgi:hypothetical protein
VAQWIILKPVEACPVWEVMPSADSGSPRLIQSGHRAGVYCKCNPCLVDGDLISILIHHLLVDGKPIRCDEPYAHACHLKEQQ